MELLARDVDSGYAFRLQIEEALAASLSSGFRNPQSPLPPIVDTSGGVVMAAKNDRNGLTPEAGSEDVRLRNRGFDFGETIVEGKRHETSPVTGVRRDDRSPNIRVGNFQNTSGFGTRRPSLVIRSQETVRPAESVGEGISKVNAADEKFNGNVLYRLYFKGLVDETIGEGKVTDVVAGFGVAICDLSDNLLFELKGQLVDGDKNRQGAEIRALTRGLTEALKLRIKHIAIFCHSYPIFQFVSFPILSQCVLLCLFMLNPPNTRVCSSFFPLVFSWGIM